jgi:hypothetical protein
MTGGIPKMIRPSDVFKNWKFQCGGETPHTFSELLWFSQGPPECPECGSPSQFYHDAGAQAPAVVGDEIDIQVRHGLCHEDGSPRRFTSMQELRKAAYDKGLSIMGETPRPNPRIVEGRLEAAAKSGRRYAFGENE